MADDSSMQEKTEDATPRKREEARDEGRVPKSQELTTAALLLGAALVLNTLGPALGLMLSTSMASGLMLAGAGPLDSASAVLLLQGVGWKALSGLGSVLFALAGLALAVTAVQARGVIAGKVLEPKWSRISPMENGKRMLGWQPWVELVKSLAKLLLVGICVYVSLRAAWGESMALTQQSPGQLLTLVRVYAVRLLMTAGLAYLALALADYAWQIFQHEKSLRMSKQEVKDEHKQNEGDPMVKARMRSMGRALARRQMMAEVPRADVVITNPTHIAVALKYDPDSFEAPVVLAMGQRKVAQRIKEIAREAGVPTVENKPLARALLASAKVGTSIPAELYLAVAEVLAWVFSRRKRDAGVRA